MKKFWKEIVRFWNRNLRPIVEPAAKVIVQAKVDKKVRRYTDDNKK